MKTAENVNQEIKAVFGEDVNGTVIEQDGIITAKVHVYNEVSDHQTEKLAYLGKFKFKRSGAGITFTVTTPVEAPTAEELELAATL
jgi:hypothetical protein